MSTKASAALQPLYLKVKRHILENIGSGKWAISARVPSENDIVKKFGVSRMTANRALKELSDEGVLVRIAGVGSFVADRQPARIRSRFAASPRRSASAAMCTAPRS